MNIPFGAFTFADLASPPSPLYPLPALPHPYSCPVIVVETIACKGLVGLIVGILLITKVGNASMIVSKYNMDEPSIKDAVLCK
jgi:hypothetical protein